MRRSTQGKIAAATQQTSAEYLKPLFKSLRKRELAPDVLLAIAEITYNMQIREYLKANDSYLRLSIGNAPWPIGVTMVRLSCHSPGWPAPRLPLPGPKLTMHLPRMRRSVSTSAVGARRFSATTSRTS